MNFTKQKWATNQAVEFLDTHSPSRPFMLFVGYYAPHSPHNPPADYFNRYYHRNNMTAPAIGNWAVPPVNSRNVFSSYVNIQAEELRTVQAGYYGNIAFLDAQIGRLLHHPEIAKNTYIIFTSDHGDMLGDHYMYQKSRPYEGSAHIPLCIMGPNISDSQRVENPVGWHDLMPTILDFAQLKIPQSVDGQSLAPLLTQAQTTTPWRDYIHGECVHNHRGISQKKPQAKKINLFYEQGSQYLTDGKIKYIWNVTSGTEQLFNLEDDWQELHDLAHIQKWNSTLLLWRNRLIQELAGRFDGLSDGKQLIAGKEVPSATPKIEKLIQQRHKEGFKLAYEPKEDPFALLEYENILMD